jgi:hypothetical protein
MERLYPLRPRHFTMMVEWDDTIKAWVLRCSKVR